MTTDHHSPFDSLNNDITISRDAPDPDNGNASHRYFLMMYERGEQYLTLREMLDEHSDKKAVAVIQFQHGPRDEPGSVPGATDQALVSILLDRYRGFQSGPFACRENALVITKLQEALLWMQKRASDRAIRGVLGKNEK